MGLASVSFRGSAPFEIISDVHNAGLSFIEWGSDVHAPRESTEMLSEIALMQSDYGIKTSSYGTYFCLGKDNPAELGRYINAAKILGTDILRVWCVDKCAEKYSECEKESFFVECLKWICLFIK